MKKTRIIPLFIVILGIIAASNHQQNILATSGVKKNKKEKRKERKECNNRGRRFGWGFLGGGTVGGVIAGVAGSAKWVPLGIVGGGLIGGGIAAATAKKCKEEK